MRCSRAVSIIVYYVAVASAFLFVVASCPQAMSVERMGRGVRGKKGHDLSTIPATNSRVHHATKTAIDVDLPALSSSPRV